jgi:hypothetical protein
MSRCCWKFRKSITRARVVLALLLVGGGAIVNVAVA